MLNNHICLVCGSQEDIQYLEEQGFEVKHFLDFEEAQKYLILEGHIAEYSITLIKNGGPRYVSKTSAFANTVAKPGQYGSIGYYQNGENGYRGAYAFGNIGCEMWKDAISQGSSFNINILPEALEGCIYANDYYEWRYEEWAEQNGVKPISVDIQPKKKVLQAQAVQLESDNKPSAATKQKEAPIIPQTTIEKPTMRESLKFTPPKTATQTVEDERSAKRKVNAELAVQLQLGKTLSNEQRVQLLKAIKQLPAVSDKRASQGFTQNGIIISQEGTFNLSYILSHNTPITDKQKRALLAMVGEQVKDYEL